MAFLRESFPSFIFIFLDISQHSMVIYRLGAQIYQFFIKIGKWSNFRDPMPDFDNSPLHFYVID